MSILSQPECNIFANIPRPDVELLSEYIRDLILATDLSLHGRPKFVFFFPLLGVYHVFFFFMEFISLGQPIVGGHTWLFFWLWVHATHQATGVILRNMEARKKRISKEYLSSKPSLDHEDKVSVMTMIMKCADLSNEIRYVLFTCVIHV